MRYLAVFCVGSFLIVASVLAESLSFGVSLYPGSELVEQTVGQKDASHQVVLGSLEKVNNVLLPERAEMVRGVKSTLTHYLPEARRTEEVGAYFLQQLRGLGEIVFECKGRSCGSSSYWANKVFNRAILYGPEQYQHYYVVRLEGDAGYLVVYVGQRATRKIYTHIELVAVDKGEARVGEVVAALASRGRFVFDLAISGSYPPELVQTARLAAIQFGRPLTLVAHDRLKVGESLADSLERTRKAAEKLVSAIKTDTTVKPVELQLEAYGVGPLAPSEIHSATRIELVVIEPTQP